MDEQKLNEAAEKYAGISEDKFANSAKKYDAYDMADAVDYGARWRDQQTKDTLIDFFMFFRINGEYGLEKGWTIEMLVDEYLITKQNG